MTDQLKEEILANPEAADFVLATLAKIAIFTGDDETMRRLQSHPGIGPKTKLLLG